MLIGTFLLFVQKRIACVLQRYNKRIEPQNF